MARVTDVRRRAAAVQAVRRVLRGDADEATVRKAQEVMRAAGYYQGPIDGIAGPETLRVATSMNAERLRTQKAAAEAREGMSEMDPQYLRDESLARVFRDEQDRIVSEMWKESEVFEAGIGASTGGSVEIRAGSNGPTGGQLYWGVNSQESTIVESSAKKEKPPPAGQLRSYDSGPGWTTAGGVDRPGQAEPPTVPPKTPVGGVDKSKPRRRFRFLDEEQDDG